MSPRMQRLGLARDNAQRQVYDLVQSLYADMRRRGCASQGFHPGVAVSLRTFADAIIDEAIAFDLRAAETELTRLKATGSCRNPFDEFQVDELNQFVDQNIRSMLSAVQNWPQGKAICDRLGGRHRDDLLAKLCEDARRRVSAEYAERRCSFDAAKLELTANIRQQLRPNDQEQRPRTGGNEQGEGAGESRAEILKRFSACVRQAYLAYQLAETMNGKRLEDREAYDYIKEYGLPDNAGDLGELSDYNLPAFDTWTRYLRDARQPLGEQKYNRRAKRPKGRSITTEDEIERPNRGE